MDSSRKALSPDYRGFYRAVAGCGNSTLASPKMIGAGLAD